MGFKKAVGDEEREMQRSLEGHSFRANSWKVLTNEGECDEMGIKNASI